MKSLFVSFVMLLVAFGVQARTFEEIQRDQISLISHMMVFHHVASAADQGVMLSLGQPTITVDRSTESNLLILHLSPVQDIASLAAILSRGNLEKEQQFYSTLVEAQRMGKEELDFISFLPTFIEQNVGKHAGFDGPNCWNAALAANDSHMEKRHIPSYEMKEFLGQEYQEIDLREKGAFLKIGDIISLWQPSSSGTREKELLHSTLYLGAGVTFDKHTWEDRHRYFFSTLKGAFDLFDMDTGRIDNKSMYRYTVHRLIKQ